MNEWERLAKKLFDEWTWSHSRFLSLYDIRQEEAFKVKVEAMKDLLQKGRTTELLSAIEEFS